MEKLYNDDFLNLLERIPNEEQKAAIRQQKNCVVAAGAGSGKTQVLATRFAWLVLTGKAKADEILTLTFTNKAASEMYQRIYKTLHFYATHPVCPELPQLYKDRAMQGLKDFANSHIQTLDSYCASILRQSANRYGIRPDFTTGDNDVQRMLEDEAFRFVLQNAQSPAVKTYAEIGKIQDFASENIVDAIQKATSLATETGFFTKNFNNQKQIILKAWNYMTDCNEVQCTELGAFASEISPISSVIPEIQRLQVENQKNAGKPFHEHTQQFLDHYDSMDFSTFQAKDFDSIDIRNVAAVEELFEKASFNKAESGYTNELRASFKPLTNNLELFHSITGFIRNATSMKSYFELLDLFLEHVNDTKRSSGSLSFKDITEMALKVLLENEDIRNQEKSAYKKIMIDEFQDNNGKNRDLLYVLSLKEGEFEQNGKCVMTDDVTKPLKDQIIVIKDGNIIEDKREPEKLFFVGDEKQSIYKFRGADVSVFNELTSTDENQILAMNCNFRSTGELLSGFNLLFKNGNGIFDLWNEQFAKRDYEAYYDRDALKHQAQLPQLNASNTAIHLCLVNGDVIKSENDISGERSDYIPEKDQIAYNMAKKIWNLGNKDCNWNDFAILDRSRTDREIITKYLSLFGIPYSVDANKNIFSEAIVNDFYNFLRLCVYPSDINSFAGYLASPFAGLGENQIQIILSHKTDVTDWEFVFDPLKIPQELKTELSPEDCAKLESAIDFYITMRPKVLKQRLTTTLSMLWNDKGYHYESMLNQTTNLMAEHFDMLFELSRQADSDRKSVSWFIDQLSKLKDSFANDSEIDASEVSYPLERDSNVQIMTIHKSKGLQFKHVFIYGCVGMNTKADRGIALHDETGFSIPPAQGYSNFFKLREKQTSTLMEIAETRRLIYVAITRAEKDVFIMGKWNPFGKPSSNPMKFFETIAGQFYQERFDKSNPLEPKGILYTDDAPFDFENIPLVEYKDVTYSKGHLTIDQIRTKKLMEVPHAIENAKLVSYTCSPIPRSTPSSLESEDGQIEQRLLFSAAPEESKPLVSQNFNAADFGTLAHAYMEALVNGISPEDFEPETKMFKDLSAEKVDGAKKECIRYTHEFAASTIGEELASSKKQGLFHRAEWEFKMFDEGTIWHGSIDLIYQKDDGSYQIIDYKSDNMIDEEKYKGQQYCYRRAAAKMLNVDESKIDCKLYFMKHKKIVEL